MDLESIFISLAVAVIVAVSYRVIRKRSEKVGDSAPAHFFGGLDDDTLLESRVHPPPSQPGPRRR